MCGIYKITNIINNHCYIGCSNNIERRWKQHKKSYLKIKTKFYNAIIKYGIENFKFEIIEECNEELLEEREIYWISYYDSYNNGYNMTLGGEGTKGATLKPVVQYDLKGNFIKEYNSVTEAMNETGINNISAVCLYKKYTSGSYQWFFKGEEKPLDLENNSYGNERSIEQYDLNGNYIQTFKSIKLAAEKTKSSENSIIKVCKHEGKQANGFQWRYSNDNDKNIKKIINPQLHKRAIAQYDLQNNLIRTYDSISEIKNFMNISTGNISSVCSGKRKTAYGYKWKYL